MPLCFWCVLGWDGCLCACDGRIFLITHLFQNQDKYMETSCHGNNVHAAHTAEFDSETGSLYSWGLKLINPHRKKSWCAMRCLLQNRTWHPNSKEQLWQVLNEKSRDYCNHYCLVMYVFVFLIDLIYDDDNYNLPQLTQPIIVDRIWLRNIEISLRHTGLSDLSH